LVRSSERSAVSPRRLTPPFADVASASARDASCSVPEVPHETAADRAERGL